jgi:glycosyltransferase involved in cell wall biosynthesis
LKAFNIVAAKHPSIELSIVGGIGSAPKEFIVDLSDDKKVKNLSKYYKDGDYDKFYFNKLKNIIKTSHLKKITFVGPVAHCDIARCYSESDIIINPSLSESFGMSLIEAMAFEKPVVATRVGGMVDIVSDGETGILVEPEDYFSLAIAIETLIETPDLRKAMGTAGRLKVEQKFTYDKVSKNLLIGYRGSLL